MGANAEGKAHILLLCWTLIMGDNAVGKAHILLLCWTIIILPLPLPQRRSDRKKKYIAACASAGLGVLLFFSHYSKGIPAN